MKRLILAAVLAVSAPAAMAHEPAVAPASAQVVDDAAVPAIAVVDARPVRACSRPRGLAGSVVPADGATVPANLTA